MKTQIVWMTPEAAQRLIDQSKFRNRPLSAKGVEKIARDILNGDFMLTHQGIALDDEGNVLDGNHRLHAIVAANKPVQILVTTGVDPNAFAVIDSVKPRTYRDYVLQSGISDADPMLGSVVVASAVKALFEFEVNQYAKLSNAEMQRLIGGLEPWIRDLHGAAMTRHKRVGAAVAAAILSALLNGEKTSAMSAFVDVYLYGDTNNAIEYNYNAALLWSNRVLREKAKQTPLKKSALYYGTQNAIWHFVNGASISKIVIPTSSKYPVKTKLSAIMGWGEKSSKDGSVDVGA